MDLEDWSWYWTSTSPTTPTHPRASSVGVERFYKREQWATSSATVGHCKQEEEEKEAEEDFCHLHLQGAGGGSPGH